MNIIKPLNKRVLVEPEAKEEISRGGIIIPETANQKAPTKGRVIAIDESSDINLKIQAGDIILFSKYSGHEVVLKGQTSEAKDRLFLVIKDEDILAVIEQRS